MQKQKVVEPLKKLCPSSSPQGWEEGVIFGAVLGTPSEPKIAYFADLQPASAEMLALSNPLQPDEVFRIATPCSGSQCRHFKDSQCSLVQRAVELLPIVTEVLPSCRLRSRCQWWFQEGNMACQRCPGIVTLNHTLPEEYLTLSYPKGDNLV